MRMFEELVPTEELPLVGYERNRLDLDLFKRIAADGLEDEYVRYDVLVHTGTDQGDLEIKSLPRHALMRFSFIQSSWKNPVILEK